MANVCPKCSTDNADGDARVPPVAARRWRGRPAGAVLLIPDEDNFDPLSAPTLVMRHGASELPPLDSILIAPEPTPRRAGSQAGWSRRRRRVDRPRCVVAASAGETTAPAPAPMPMAHSRRQRRLRSRWSRHHRRPPRPASLPPRPRSPRRQRPDRRKRIPEPVGRKQAMEAAPAASPGGRAGGGGGRAAAARARIGARAGQAQVGHRGCAAPAA